MKNLFKIFLSIVLVIMLASTSVSAAATSVSGIQLDKSKLSLLVKETYVLKTRIIPADAANKSLIFSSGNKNIAKVDKNGKITALKKGKTVIIVSSAADKKITAKCTVTVSLPIYKDGIYIGQSVPDQRGNYGKVTLVIKGGRIVSVDFKGYLKDGSVKDENYGKSSTDENYQKAQTALKGSAVYGPKLVEVQDPAKVDAVSGATNSYNDFKAAVQIALQKAKI